MLDEAGLPDCMIVASNSLDEYTISSLNRQGAKIDSYGVGERLITSSSTPVFGAVYKLVAIQKDGKFIPKIKISETAEKITNPGIKEVYRVYDENGKAVAGYLAVKGEQIRDFEPGTLRGSGELLEEPQLRCVVSRSSRCLFLRRENGSMIFRILRKSASM